MARTLLAVLGAVAEFAAVAAILLYFMPGPVEDSDYLVAGSIATLAALLALFLGLALGRAKMRDIFFKKRPKQP